jgi:hypothetical protein
VWLNFFRSNWIVVLAAVGLLGGTTYLRWTEPLPVPPPDPRFALIGPQGKSLVANLPELAKVPPLDLAAACALVQSQNDKLRAVNKTLAAERPALDISPYVRATTEAGCVDASRRDHRFYDALSDALTAPTQTSRQDAYQMAAALREALRSATSPEEVVETLAALNARTAMRGDRLHEPDLFLLAAEVMAVRTQYCDGEERAAAKCRGSAHKKRGDNLFDAGRWRADARLLRASIEANREALRELGDKSGDWLDLHARIGDALAQLSEQETGGARRALLRQALDEYEIVAGPVRSGGGSTAAMINQNVCSIRQPLAALDKDRANTRLAIEECEMARAYYAKNEEKTNEAAAHYNMARALEKLADWDQDEAAALEAVDHVRRTVQLYAEDEVTLSVAFGRVHLADALVDASALVQKRADDASRARARAMRTEARESLDAAEPVLRAAKAAGYLASLEQVRRRLGRDATP